MKKWIFLFAIVAILIVVGLVYRDAVHDSFFVIIAFFTILTLVMFRVDALVSSEWSAQANLAKIVVRLLASMSFITYLMLTSTERFDLVVQFMALYFVFMIFEIVVALTNLRQN